MAGPANSINEQTTGICGFTSTAFVGSPATQHCVQIGSTTTSTLASVTNGTTGQFLGANTGSAPTWQTPSSAPPSPISVTTVFEDFTATQLNGGDTLLGNIPWIQDSNNFPWAIDTTNQSNAHPGVYKISQVTANGITFFAFGGNVTTAFLYGYNLGGGVLSYTWVVRINTLSVANPRYIFQCGLMNCVKASTQTFTDGVYFQYSDNVNSGAWTINSVAASTPTNTNTASTVTAGWYNLTFTVNAAASSIEFFVNGSSQGTISTNIPTVALCPVLSLKSTVGTTADASLSVDLFYLTQTLTTPR